MNTKPNSAIQQVLFAIAAVAGLWTLFHLYWNVIAKSTADDYWGYALLVLFVVSVGVAFVAFAQERVGIAAAGSTERFPEPATAKFFLATEGAGAMWFVVRMYVGSEWVLAGIAKVQEGFGGAAIKGFAQGALGKTAGPNPSVQGWYAWFLQHIVIPNAGVWAFAITWGEVAVGLGLLVGALTGIAAGFGLLMNLNYLLSGTVSINPVLGILGLFLVLSWRVCGWIGFDRVLLPAIGLPWKPGPILGEMLGTKRTPTNLPAVG